MYEHQKASITGVTLVGAHHSHLKSFLHSNGEYRMNKIKPIFQYFQLPFSSFKTPYKNMCTSYLLLCNKYPPKSCLTQLFTHYFMIPQFGLGSAGLSSAVSRGVTHMAIVKLQLNLS